MTNPKRYDAVLGGNRPGPCWNSGSVVMGITNRYYHPNHKQFCLDMASIQIAVKHYESNFYWSGPAVEASDIQDVLSYTKIRCLWNEIGKNRWMVYPRCYRQESIIEIKKLIDIHQPLVHDRSAYASSESYRRQFDAFVETLEFEFEFELAK